MKTRLETRPPAADLPVEVLLQVVSYIAKPPPDDDHEIAPRAKIYDKQRTLHACSLVNRNWHEASIEELYRYPLLTSRNYDDFVRTICPSVNLHIKKTDLASMVKVLDLRQLVFAGTKSFVARLLSRVKENLEILKAPQTSFAVNSLAALSKCQKLHTLDMNFVTESIPIMDFFRVIEKMGNLHTISMPRSSFLSPKEGQTLSANGWPAKLQNIVIPSNVWPMLARYGPRQAVSIDTLTRYVSHERHLASPPSWSLRFTSVRRLRLMNANMSDWQRNDVRRPSFTIRSMAWLSTTRVLEMHWMGSVFQSLDDISIMHSNEDQDYDSDDPDDTPGGPSLASLEDIVLGPYAESAEREALQQWGDVWDDWPVHWALPLGHVRRVFVHYDAAQPLPPASLDRLIYIHNMLIEAERARVDAAERGDERGGGLDLDGAGGRGGDELARQPYAPRECGVYTFPYDASQDLDERMAWARPVEDLTRHFSREVVASWPHARFGPEAAER